MEEVGRCWAKEQRVRKVKSVIRISVTGQERVQGRLAAP